MRRKLSAICLLPSVLILAACGGGNNATKTTTVTASASAASTTARTTSSSPTPTGSGDPLYDRYAAAMRAAGVEFRPGTGVSQTYATDKSICESLRKGTVDAWQLAGREGVARQDNNGRRIVIMIPMLCPDQQPVLDEALSPRPIMQTFMGGKAFVSWVYDDAHHVVQPGTWKTGIVSDCYWERLDGQGNIIDNNMVSLSQSVVVTIAESDAAFNSQKCGSWTRVN